MVVEGGGEAVVKALTAGAQDLPEHACSAGVVSVLLPPS